MKKIFADTSYWIALIDRNDMLYKKAKDLPIGFNLFHIFTTQLVIIEFLNAFSNRGTHLKRAAYLSVDEIASDSNVTVIPFDRVQLESAIAMYRKYLDKSWSLTDCVSFIVRTYAKTILTDGFCNC